MGKLTKAQLETLSDIARWPSLGVRFSTGEALRRKGLVARYTTLAIGADYADQDGVHEQWRGEMKRQHEWEITPAGRTALSEGER